jgi:C-terminal, D2-small domain, of ClpB protein
MKRKPRISLSLKKTRQGRKARAAVAVCDRVFSTGSAGHVGVAGIVYLGGAGKAEGSMDAGNCARPLKRFLQRHLETVLSRQILAGAMPENSLVTVSFKKGQLPFESVPLSKGET